MVCTDPSRDALRPLRSVDLRGDGVGAIRGDRGACQTTCRLIEGCTTTCSLIKGFISICRLIKDASRFQPERIPKTKETEIDHNSQIVGHFVTKTTNVRRKEFTVRTVRCGNWCNDLFTWMSIRGHTMYCVCGENLLSAKNKTKPLSTKSHKLPNRHVATFRRCSSIGRGHNTVGQFLCDQQIHKSQVRPMPIYPRMPRRWWTVMSRMGKIWRYIMRIL